MKTEEHLRYPAYVEEVPRWWWLKTRPFRRFVLRELTSLFVAVFAVVLLLFLLALSRGRAAYEGFLDWLDLPAVIVFHVVVLAAVVYHTITSIQLASLIQEVRLGGKPVPRRAVATGLVGGWVVASAIVGYINVEL